MGGCLAKTKLLTKKRGDSCLIHSVDLSSVGVQRFLTEGLVYWVQFSLGGIWPFIDLTPIAAVNG